MNLIAIIKKEFEKLVDGFRADVWKDIKSIDDRIDRLEDSIETRISAVEKSIVNKAEKIYTTLEGN